MADDQTTTDQTTTTTPGDTTQPGLPDLSWQGAIPAEYKTDKVWEPVRAKPLGDVLKGYAEAQKLVGSSIRLPAKDAKPEDLAKWKAEHGPKLSGLFPSAPESPDKYQFDRPEAAIELGWDEDGEKYMRAAWHKAGLSNDQVKATIQAYAEMQTQRLNQALKLRADTEQTLKQEWGRDYEPLMGRAVRFTKESGEEFGIPALLSTTGLGDNPNIIRWVSKLSKMAVQHGAMDSAVGTPMSDDELSRRASEIRTEMMKTNAGSARMNELQTELEGLYRRRTRAA